LIKIPVQRIYQENELSLFIGFAPNWLSRTVTNIDKKNVVNEDGEPNDIQINTEYEDKRTQFEVKLCNLLKRAKAKISSHNKALASAGIANALMVSRIEGLKEHSDLTTNGESIQMVNRVEIVQAK